MNEYSCGYLCGLTGSDSELKKKKKKVKSYIPIRKKKIFIKDRSIHLSNAGLNGVHIF